MINKIQYLKWVPFNKQDYVIMASAVLIAHGIDMINNDLDIAVRPEILHDFLSKRDVTHEQNYIIGNSIELSYTGSKMFNRLNTNADIIEGYSFMSLFDLREMYIDINREKNKEKILTINRLMYGEMSTDENNAINTIYGLHIANTDDVQ